MLEQHHPYSFTHLCTFIGVGYKLVEDKELEDIAPVYAVSGGSKDGDGRAARVTRRVSVVRISEAPRLCFGIEELHHDDGGGRHQGGNGGAEEEEKSPSKKKSHGSDKKEKKRKSDDGGGDDDDDGEGKRKRKKKKKSGGGKKSNK